MPHHDSLAQEMTALSNTAGGLIVVGNDKTATLNGFAFGKIQSSNLLLVNVAWQGVYPSIIITTETVTVNGNNLIVV